jgi:tetratricopeptide (TPR) repeat protein
LHSIEYYYRQGRIFQELNNNLGAINSYNTAIQIGSNNSAYYASRAALECGKIYEKLNNKVQANAYYNKCLAMDNHDYKTSIDQQAKAGLQRIGQ